MCCWFSPMACYAITKWLGYTSYACNTTTELDTHQGECNSSPFFLLFNGFTGVSTVEIVDNYLGNQSVKLKPLLPLGFLKTRLWNMPLNSMLKHFITSNNLILFTYVTHHTNLIF